MKPLSPKNSLKPFMDQNDTSQIMYKDQFSHLVDLGKHAYIDRRKKSYKLIVLYSIERIKVL